MLVDLYRHTGPEPLSDADLLALALGPTHPRGPRGVAADLLDRHGSVTALVRAGPEALAEVPGLGRARATRLHAGLALGRRSTAGGVGDDEPVHTPADSARRLGALFFRDEQEQVGALYLNARHRVVGARVVSEGGTTSAIVDPRVILGLGLRLGATCFVLAHTHPSGDPEPSETDIATTHSLARAGRVVGLPLLDHLVFGGGAWVSMASRGLMS